MIDFLLYVFDIPLSIILIIFSLFNIFVVKKSEDMFVNIFIAIFFMIFIASIILVKQLDLGEFIIASIMLLFVVVFLMYILISKDRKNVFLEDSAKWKKILVIISFFCLSGIIAWNFIGILNKKTEFNYDNILVIKEREKALQEKSAKSADEIVLKTEREEYNENISLLNQNRIFQKFTNIILFYAGMVIILYFFNKEDDDEG